MTALSTAWWVCLWWLSQALNWLAFFVTVETLADLWRRYTW